MTLSVPKSFNRYQLAQAPDTYTVKNVHIQMDNTTVKRSDNTEVTLKGIIFVDARLSTPHLDYQTLQEQVQAVGGVMTCTVTDKRGKSSGQFTILVVDGLPDDEDNLHHWELGVV